MVKFLVYLNRHVYVMKQNAVTLYVDSAYRCDALSGPLLSAFVSKAQSIFLIFFFTTVNPRYNDSKEVAIKMNLLLYRILTEQIDM